ncbi:hypothetical protein OQA88_13438 [Cercophora sp. LCS_1]
MSWTRVLNGYQTFKDRAVGAVLPGAPPGPPRFPVTIWEVRDGSSPAICTHLSENFHPTFLKGSARIRIILAPVDHVLEQYSHGILGLCDALSIPPDFLTERLQNVCHSFGTQTDEQGFAAWFHYLCKMIRRDINHDWQKYGFFLRKDCEGNVALVCFGASPAVKNRLQNFINAGAWTAVEHEPLVLFDLVLDGLYTEVDTTVWDLLDDISRLERTVLVAADAKVSNSKVGAINFSELHDWAKNLIHLGEVVESCLLTVKEAISYLEDRGEGNSAVSSQLRERLRYRRSLFNSTKLRLDSLSKRVNNTINLAFNLVTQQDSRLMVRDSTSMAIISFVTVIFLPTAGVAAVIGSQLFVTERSEENGALTVTPSPLFTILWWIAVPLTLLTTGFALYCRLSAVPRRSKAQSEKFEDAKGARQGWTSSSSTFDMYPSRTLVNMEDASVEDKRQPV